MKQRLFYVLVLCALTVSSAFAQSRTITGRVTSAEDGSSLPGVTVHVQGTTVGTQTNADGGYNLSVPANATALVFSYLGHTGRTVTIGNQSTINVSLEAEAGELSQVVVTGYGTQRRGEITGSVASIGGDEFQDVALPSFDKFLQGQVAGVQSSTPSGILGQPARVRIRGTNSISSSSEPLYVVDGVPYITGDQSAITPNNPLGDINPNDIASVDVLKDGAATAIYGSRAANGVILITTKRGRMGAPRLTYDNWFSSAKASKRFDLMNAEEFMLITNEKLTNAGLAEAAFPLNNEATGQPYETDWQDEVLQTAFQQNHALSFSGATEQTNYYFSLGYTDMEGIIQANGLTKYSVRAKLDQKAFDDRLSVGINTGVTHTTNRGLNTNENALSNNMAGALFAFPNVPAIYPDGSYNFSSDGAGLGQGANTRSIYGNYTNQRFVLDNNIYKSALLNVTGSAYADLKIVEGLNARTQIGVNYLNGEDYMFWDPRHGDGKGVNGRIYQYFLPTFRWNWQNTLTYDKALTEDHRISVVAGQELQKTKTRWFFAHGTDLSSTYFGENENIISGSLANSFIGGSASENAMESYFARANYSFQDKYLLSATIRHDLISSLPHGNQSATLPGASIGWRLTQEEFFNVEFFNDLKIRGGWAKVGNTEIGNYPYAGVFAAAQYGDFSGIRYNQTGNPDLRFETSKKINVGLDATFLNSRVNFTFDYFKNQIDNLILGVPTPPSLGVPGNSISQNVGEMFNQGVEFDVNARIIERDDFSWTSSINFTKVKNEIQTLVAGNDMTYTYHVNREGYPIGSFFGYQSHGVNAANGNPIFEKEDGSLVQQVVGKTTYVAYDPENPGDVATPAAALTFADKRILGEANPTWFGGFNNTFAYKGFDLNIFLTFSGGNKVYNRTRQESLNNMHFANAGRELLDRWTEPGQNTDVPKMAFGYQAYINQEGHLNSRFLENGNFLRAQNIGIGYNFDNLVLGKLNANKVRVFAQVQNAFIITNYSGIDPEVSQNLTSNSQPSLDNRTNPVPRTFTVGINVGF